MIHESFKDSGEFTKAFQKYGNRIRFQGNIRPMNSQDGTPQNHIFDLAKRINSFIKVLRHPVSTKEHSSVRVVIDSLKNLYEGVYLRSRYSAFYLISVSRDNEFRKKRLEARLSSSADIDVIDFNERPNQARKLFEQFCDFIDKKAQAGFFVDTEPREGKEPENPAPIFEHPVKFADLLQQIDSNEDIYNAYKTFAKKIKDTFAAMPALKKECGIPKKIFNSCMEALDDDVRVFSYSNKLQQFFLQDIESCIQDADIFIANNELEGGKENLKYTILRYVSLMLHPGLLTPSPVERCMQIAYTAKLNSGCISRQVGAVTTDRFYNILSIGWNDVPCGQTSCNRRNLMDIVRFHDLYAYSNFEKGKDTPFRLEFLDKFDFSDDKLIKTILFGLPASYCFKDAYFEITGDRNQVHTRALHGEEKALLLCDQEAIKGGYLFTTSSPCELCSKNAKEHKIKAIYYIEPYPGISQDHICDSGDMDNRARYQLFEGAIGRAYTQLFTPLMPYKDELELRGINKFRKPSQ